VNWHSRSFFSTRTHSGNGTGTIFSVINHRINSYVYTKYFSDLNENTQGRKCVREELMYLNLENENPLKVSWENNKER